MFQISHARHEVHHITRLDHTLTSHPLCLHRLAATCPSPDIIGNIERSVPGRHRQSNLRSCRWDTDNASCSSSVTGSRAEIENHLRAYHRVRDDVRTVICLWEGCVRTRPLRRENLARHVMTHMNIRWECPECKKLFSRSDAVQRHVERVCPRRGYDAA